MSDIALQEAIEVIGRDTLIRLAQELTSARRSHSVVYGHEDAASALESEFYEWKSQAGRVVRRDGFHPEKRERAESEAWHIVTTALRYVGREYQ